MNKGDDIINVCMYVSNKKGKHLVKGWRKIVFIYKPGRIPKSYQGPKY